MTHKKWSASLICADLFHLARDISILDKERVDYLHVDVMDGSFVPRLGMYPEMVQKIKEISSIPIEVHLMIHNPEAYISAFAEAGTDILTIHAEACRADLFRAVEAIQKRGLKAGIALNPATELEELPYLKGAVDYLLIMGINPGILSQKIKPFIFDKIRKYRDKMDSIGMNCEIIIDGGVNFDNYERLFREGADILVGGSQTIFHPSQSILDNLIKIKKAETLV